MFSIEITRDLSPEEALGSIVIDDFRETFRASLTYWGRSEYQRSWIRAFRELESDVAATSCLVTSITDPGSSNFISTWPLYRSQDVVFIQNSLIFLDELTSEFDPDEPWRSVLPREKFDEDGNRISEWSTSFEVMKTFFASFGA